MRTHDPEFTAVILAATCGARLFPITNSGDDEDDDDDEDGFGGGGGDDDSDQSLHTATRTSEHSYATAIDGNNKEGEGGGGEEETKQQQQQEYTPKHLLPLVGRPILYHLLLHLKSIGFELCIVAVGSNDDVTVPALVREMNTASDSVLKKGKGMAVRETKSKDGGIHTLVWEDRLTIEVVRLPGDCGGSADALRYLSKLNHDTPSAPPILPPKSHCMVLPGDLVLYGHLENSSSTSDALSSLADAHRSTAQTNTYAFPRPSSSTSTPPTAVTLLLTDVSEYDDNGHPLKESAKAKKGGLARDDDEIEYVALSSPPPRRHPPSRPSSTPTAAPTTNHPPAAAPSRLLLKQSKYSVEESVGATAATPKLLVPKSLTRRSGSDGPITVRTDWSDVHVFCVSPWVVGLLHARKGVRDLSKELVPLLVGRQWRGVRATFGGAAEGKGKEEEEEGRSELEKVLGEPPFRRVGGGEGEEGGRRPSLRDGDAGGGSGGGGKRAKDYPYAVSAVVLSRAASRLTLRACTVPAYLYACRETILHATAAATNGADKKTTGLSHGVPLPPDVTLDTKFNSLLLTQPPSSPTSSPHIPTQNNNNNSSSSNNNPKNQIKSSTVGRRSRLGSRCRLNNVVVMDDVTVGDNCVLQNSVLARGCSVGENCNLKECQVGSGYRVVDGTKATGECFFNG